MLKRLRALGDKIRYINRLIIEIDKKQTALQLQNAELAEKLRETYSHIDKMNRQIEELGEKQEKTESDLLSVVSRLEDEWKNVTQYVNPEYLMLPDTGRTRYLLAGFYGAVNLGDELMLQKLYQDLNPVKNDVYVLMCDNAGLDVFRYPGVNIIHYPKNKFDFNFLASRFDCVIFGGGAIIDDAKYSLSDSYKYDLGKIFIELSSAFIGRGKRVYSLGLSTNDSLADARYTARLKSIIDNSAYFSVRDKYSAAVLQDIAGHQIRQINDIVLTYESPEVPAIAGKKYRIGIIWICNDDLKGLLYELLEHILSRYDMDNTEVRFIPFYNYCDCDPAFYHAVCRKIGNESFTAADMPGSFSEAYREICQCDLVITMRYHGALLGLKGERRTLSLLYSQHKHYYNKMQDLYEKFQQEQDLFTSIEQLKEALPVNQDYVSRKIEFDNSEYDTVIRELINLCDN